MKNVTPKKGRLLDGSRYRWHRDPEGPLFGVCEGIAKATGIEAWMVRLIWIAAFLLFGSGLVFYAMCVLAMPKKDDQQLGETGKFLGVCWKLADKLDCPVMYVRMAALALAIGSLGTAVLGYFGVYLVFGVQNHKRLEATSRLHT